MSYEKLPTTKVNSTAEALQFIRGSCRIHFEQGINKEGTGSSTVVLMKDLGEFLWESQIKKSVMEKLTNPHYGSAELDENLDKLAENALPIERIWEITERFPTLINYLSEELDDE